MPIAVLELGCWPPQQELLFDGNSIGPINLYLVNGWQLGRGLQLNSR